MDHRQRSRAAMSRTIAAIAAGALVLGTTTALGAASPANAAIGAVAADAPVTQDITLDKPVYRTPFFPIATATLAASGGSGEITYSAGAITGPNGDTGGNIEIVGDTAKINMNQQDPVGEYSFPYTATDSAGESSTSTVRFSIENLLANVRDLRFTTSKDKPFDAWPYARDPETGGPFPWTWTENSFSYGEPEHGELVKFFTPPEDPSDSVASNFAAIQHKITYVPDPGFVGTDSFTYTLTDGDGDESTGSITVDVVDPGTTARGVLNDVRYRCAFAIRANMETGEIGNENDPVDPGTSNLVNMVMGGDVTFRVDVRAHMPTTLAPGEKFKVRDTAIDLKMAQPMAELLAGSDITAAPVDAPPPLDEAGFGQIEVGGAATATAVFTESATGKSYEVPMSGLRSAMVPMSLPIPSDGVRIPVMGGLPELTAPRSGELSVSMPKKFFINSILNPGVLGGMIKKVGLDCTAMEGESLVIASAPIVDPVASKVAASASTVRYGVAAPKVNVSVAPAGATGTVEVRKGTTVLGKAKVAGGKASVTLPRTALKPGAHTLSVRYSGDVRTKASTGSVRVSVTKAKASLTAKVTTKKVVAKKTRAKVRVTVKAPGVKPGGTVAIYAKGKKIGTAKVGSSGIATVTLKKLPKAGKVTLKVRYLGSATTGAATKTIKVAVKKRR